MSSSAQLTLLPYLWRWEPPADRTTFAAGLHAGSAAGLAYSLVHDQRNRGGVNVGQSRPHDSVDQGPWGTAGRVVLATIPAAAVGYAAQDVVERRLGGPRTTAALMAGAGVALWWADRKPQDQQLGTREAVIAGLGQVAALAPGVSRSGASLTALRAMRVPRAEAARFSTLMSLPITAGGAALTAARSRALPPVVPAVVAGFTAATLSRRVSGGSRGVIAGSALYRLGVAWAVARRQREQR